MIDSDTTLLPGMTTGNAILTATLEDALFIPLEAVTTEGELTFVYKRTGRGIVRQEIETGLMNDNHIVVLRGLEEGDEVLLTPPSDAASLALERLPGKADAPTTTAASATIDAPATTAARDSADPN